MIQLGVKVRDRLTGFTGLVTGRSEYISGCNQYLVNPPVKADGDYVNGQWLDEQRCEVIDTRAVLLENGTTPGFGPPAPTK